jgi:hypothetical protein
MVTKIFRATYVDGIPGWKRAVTLPPAGASRACLSAPGRMRSISRTDDQGVLPGGSRALTQQQVFGDMIDASYRHLWPEGDGVPWSEKLITVR